MNGSRIDCDPPSAALLREVVRDIESNSLCKWRFTGISVFHQIVEDVVTAALRCKGFHSDCVTKEEHEQVLIDHQEELNLADSLVDAANEQVDELSARISVLKLKLAEERDSNDEGT